MFWPISLYLVVKQLRLLATLFIITIFCSSWGFFAHKRINHVAVFTLPRAMKGFYTANIAFVTEHATSADKRRYVDSTEGSRHFLDADRYGKNPFGALPHNFYDAAAKYTADTLDKYGTVPWAIEYNYYRLVKAFKDHDTSSILNTSANLGHYIADAHVPLHLTENYNGQLTNQLGIHALWETRIPELYSHKYNYFVGKARYIDNPLAEAFKICRASFKEVDSVLRFERTLNKTYPANKKYEVTQRGKRNITDYSPGYAAAYQRMLNGMVQRRMRSAILAVGSFWYSAWVDAGQPDLNKMIAVPATSAERRQMLAEEALYRSGKVLVLVN